MAAPDAAADNARADAPPDATTADASAADVAPVDAPVADVAPADATSDDARPDDVAPADVAPVDAATDVARDGDRIPPIDWARLPLPRDTRTGRLLLQQLPGVRLMLDPSANGPSQAYGRCAAVLVECMHRAHDIDRCVADAPTCATATPWGEAVPCCPSTCRDAYSVARAGGMDARQAMRSAYGDRPRCMPGLRAATGDAP